VIWTKIHYIRLDRRDSGMDISYENSVTNPCKNIFVTDVSDQSAIKERFTKLWTQIICEKENDVAKKNSGQTNIFKL